MTAFVGSHASSMAESPGGRLLLGRTKWPRPECCKRRRPILGSKDQRGATECTTGPRLNATRSATAFFLPESWGEQEEGSIASRQCVTPVGPFNGIARGALASLRPGCAH
jgi:hypothetical protein